ncbi:MAG TPA: hypothetical protein VGX21_23175 [Methylomirabilota bacterium]|jgi:hypothetical protein|nr:hypothetical protein [Methylomirabilota bacterium]
MTMPNQHDEVYAQDGGRRQVRIPESIFLARPDLWSRDGLEEYLREHGIDIKRPYFREEVFVQDLRAAA